MSLTRRPSSRAQPPRPPASRSLAACAGGACGGDTAPPPAAGGTDRVSTSARSPTAPRRQTDDQRSPAVDVHPRRAARRRSGTRHAERSASARCRPGSPPLALRRHRPEDPHRLRTRPRPPGRRASSDSSRSSNNATWENLFVGIDSGSTTSASPTSPTPRSASRSTTSPPTARTTSASRRSRPATWTFTGDYQALAGRRSPSARAPTRRRSCWSGRASCRPRARTSPSSTSRTTTPSSSHWTSGKIDTYLGPNPGVAYQVAQSAEDAQPDAERGQPSPARANRCRA